jgi:environmental stress-induced protein Ves
MRLLHVRDYRRARWKNDGGWTTEIASNPTPEPGTSIAADFRWRVSIAEIECDGPFSSFPGIDRDLLVLAGNGIELDINDATAVRLDQRFQRIHFAGEDHVQCRLLAGATRDFNVMTRRDAVVAEVIARPLNGTMLIFAEPQVEWLIHVFSGHARARAGDNELTADVGETLLLGTNHSEHERIVLDGAGELVLVKFTHA